jgi:type VI secretion system secreted protein Hcp
MVPRAPALNANPPVPAPAPRKGSDYFLLIEGIPGESKDAKRKDNIRLEGFCFREVQPAQTDVGEGRGASRVQAGCFTFQCRLDRATPKLFLACAQGD